jgi:hypothetical protein
MAPAENVHLQASFHNMPVYTGMWDVRPDHSQGAVLGLLDPPLLFDVTYHEHIMWYRGCGPAGLRPGVWELFQRYPDLRTSSSRQLLRTFNSHQLIRTRTCSQHISEQSIIIHATTNEFQQLLLVAAGGSDSSLPRRGLAARHCDKCC